MEKVLPYVRNKKEELDPILTLASDRADLFGTVALSILIPSTKNWYSSFLKKVFGFEKSGFKVKY